MKHFEDFNAGDEYNYEATYTVTEAEICEVGERWDPQPFHIDPVAAESSLFGGLVASSVLLHAILFALGNTPEKEATAALSILGFDNIRVRAPARPGHVLMLRDTVLECRVSNSRPELGIVRNRGELINQDGEVVYSCEGTYLVERRS